MGTTDEHALSGEEWLIQAAIEGDGRAYRKLVEPHLSVLFRIASRTCKNTAMAEDAVQDCLTIAYKQLHKFRKGASFRGYLAAITVRKAHTLARSERRRLRREDATSIPTTPNTPEELLDLSRTREKIQALIAKMPKKRREIALLRLDAGMNYREIGEALGTSEQSARVLFHLAQKQLREGLSELIREPSSMGENHEAD